MTDAELDVLFEQRFAYQKAHAAANMRELDASTVKVADKVPQQYRVAIDNSPLGRTGTAIAVIKCRVPPGDR